MPSGEHQEGAAAAKVAGADGGVGKAGEPARPIRITPAPVSSPEQAEEHVRAALAAGTRTGASLSALVRAVEEMNDGLSGAREANEQLVKELEAMRQMLAESTDENASLEEQVAALGAERDQALRELAQMRSEAERERDFFMEEQDRFLAALLDDHEQAVAALRCERDEARAAANRHERPTRPGKVVALDGDPSNAARQLLEAQQTIEKLMKERNRSREMLRRLQAQRDEAQAALAGAGDTQPLNVTVRTNDAPPREGRSTAPQGPRGGRSTAPQGAGAQSAAADSERTTDPLPRRAQPPVLSPPPGAPRRRTTEPGLAAPTPPPEELRGAIMLPATPADVTPRVGDGRPALKRKPDPTERPLGGYSLGADEVEVERVGGTRRGNPKPRH